MLTREYDLWGNPIQGSASSGYAFTGREWDSETSLYYYRARYYDPKIGRFISEDPIGFRAGANFYSYVKNRAISSTDPFGLRIRVQLTEKRAEYSLASTCTGAVRRNLLLEWTLQVWPLQEAAWL